MRSDKPILLVEDDRVDQMTVQRALKEIKVVNQLDVAQNGEEALDHLRRVAPEKPCLILLDLNMPRMNGVEFLRALRQEDAWRAIPVIVFTTSQEERDVVESFRLGVAGFMHKPVDYAQFVDVMRAINLYWTLSELPP